MPEKQYMIVRTSSDGKKSVDCKISWADYGTVKDKNLISLYRLFEANDKIKFYKTLYTNGSSYIYDIEQIEEKNGSDVVKNTGTDSGQSVDDSKQNK